jgi:hypothetical protein
MAKKGMGAIGGNSRFSPENEFWAADRPWKEETAVGAKNGGLIPTLLGRQLN